ncbi:MAG TPA: hypothetical protein VMB91_04640 [Solirubrobacteraceae bacterium]|nr:hypothetical protein [Solirubrobacteraceae bacterium]
MVGAIPLEDLNVAELSELLAKRPGLKSLPEGTLRSALEELLAALAKEGVTVEGLGEPGEIVPELEATLKKLLSPSELIGLLKGQNLTELLTNALGSVEPKKLVAELVTGSENPGEVVTQALSAVNPEKLESAVGSTLAGEPFSTTTVGELANSSGTTEQGFTEALGTSSEQLPPTAMALTAPLTDGKTLGVLDGTEGLTLATLEGAEGGVGGLGGSGGVGGIGGRGGAGSAGGTSSGGAGASGSPTTVVIDAPGPSGPSTTGSSATVGKVKVISRKVHNGIASVVVQVPGPGRLTLSGHGVKSVSRQTDAGERVTVKTSLTKAGVASRSRHRHGIAVQLKVDFKPVSGPSSAANTTVRFG